MYARRGHEANAHAGTGQAAQCSRICRLVVVVVRVVRMADGEPDHGFVVKPVISLGGSMKHREVFTDGVNNVNS